MNRYFVYLLASRRNGTLYCSVTNDLARRVWEHRNGKASAFTSKYRVTQLVWFEEHGDATAAIHRETQIKWWKRSWKLKLIEDFNPDWRDLYDSLLPGLVRTYEKPPIVDPKKATRQHFAPDDPFLRSFDTSDRPPPISVIPAEAAHPRRARTQEPHAPPSRPLGSGSPLRFARNDTDRTADL